MQALIVPIAPLLFLGIKPVRVCNPAQYAPRPSLFITGDPSCLADHRIISMFMAQAILELIAFGSFLQRRRNAPPHFFPILGMNQFDPVVATEDLRDWSEVGTNGVSTHLFNLIAL